MEGLRDIGLEKPLYIYSLMSFSGNLENNLSDDGSMTFEISEGSSKTPLKT